MDTVSVIIPVYNEETELPRCLDTVLAQTHPDLDIILVNDGSKDRSGEVCDAYAARDRRIRVIHQANAGVSMARNAGIAAARGEYLQFVDADDEIAPEMTARLLTPMRDGMDVVMCGFLYRQCYPDGKRLESESPLPAVGIMDAREFLQTCTRDRPTWLSLFHSQCNKMYRRDILSANSIAFATGMTSSEDGLFNFHYLAHCQRAAIIDVRPYVYIQDMSPGKAGVGWKYYPGVIRDFLTLNRAAAALFSQRLPEEEQRRRMAIMADLIILAVVKFCRRDATMPREAILAALDELTRQPDVQQWFRQYRPGPGQSRLMPFFFRHRLVRPLYYEARRRADKRYGAHYGYA